MSLTKVSYSMINGEVVNVLDYGAVGDGVTNDTAAIQAAIDYVHSLPQVPKKPTIYFPSGRYAIYSTLQLYNDISLVGQPRDVGYWFGWSHTSELLAYTAMDKMVDVTGSNIYIGDLGFYGNGNADYALYTAGTFGRGAGQFVFENLSITLCNKSGMYINNCGLAKISRVQVSDCDECAMDFSGFGDADIEGCYINTVNQDSSSTVNAPSNATVYGVGMRFRADPVSGGFCGNINIRGGKIEFTRVGILLNAAQGINISGINFDTNRAAGVWIESDNMTPFPNTETYNQLTCTSIQITGNRFLGGDPKLQGTTAHIFVGKARYITISGNGFKRANDAAADFYSDPGAGAVGPTIGVRLLNAELCTVVGNDLYGAATTNCLTSQIIPPFTNAQHVIFANALDNTELIDLGTVRPLSSFGDIYFSPGFVPYADNTAKAWAKVNGGSLTIYDSYNVTSVTSGATGVTTINYTMQLNEDQYVINASIGEWTDYTDAIFVSALSDKNFAVVETTTSGVLTASGLIHVTSFSR
jgi:hypothetical protein